MYDLLAGVSRIRGEAEHKLESIATPVVCGAEGYAGVVREDDGDTVISHDPVDRAPVLRCGLSRQPSPC